MEDFNTLFWKEEADKKVVRIYIYIVNRLNHKGGDIDISIYIPVLTNKEYVSIFQKDTNQLQKNGQALVLIFSVQRILVSGMLALGF